MDSAIAEHLQDTVAEWSTAVAPDASPQGRGFEPRAVMRRIAEHRSPTWWPRTRTLCCACLPELAGAAAWNDYPEERRFKPRDGQQLVSTMPSASFSANSPRDVGLILGRKGQAACDSKRRMQNAWIHVTQKGCGFAVQQRIAETLRSHSTCSRSFVFLVLCVFPARFVFGRGSLMTSACEHSCAESADVAPCLLMMEAEGD